jgi:hypothetical protein
MFGLDVGLAQESFAIAATTVRRIDHLTETQFDIVAADSSLAMKRLGLALKVPVGVRIMLKPFVLEPYAGVEFKDVLTRMGGAFIDRKDLWTMEMRFGWPVGANLYLYLARNIAIVFNFEWDNDTAIMHQDYTDYDKSTKRTMSAAFSSIRTSSIVFGAGATF